MITAEVRQQAVAEYLEGLELRKQGYQLSNENLAEKFERSVRTIKRVINGQPTNVPADEAQLIRDRASERDRIKSKAAERKRDVLAKKYGVCSSTISYWVDNPIAVLEVA